MTLVEFLVLVALAGFVSRAARATYRLLVGNRGWSTRAIVAVLGMTYGVRHFPSVMSLIVVAVASAAGVALAANICGWVSGQTAAIAAHLAGPVLIDEGPPRSTDASLAGARRRRCHRAPQVS